MDLTHVRFTGIPTQPPARQVRLSSSTIERRASVADPPLGDVQALVLRHAGLRPDAYRAKPLERRLPACLRALRVSSTTAATSHLLSYPGAHHTALNALLVGVSSFFRDEPVFEHLRHHVVPALGRLDRPARVLSVGCSNGAELFSIAMLLDEAGLLRGSELVGTDCRSEAIVRARQGVFHDEEMSAVEAAHLHRWFERVSTGWRIRTSLQQQTRWFVSDATRLPSTGSWDLILCRNVVIYLKPAVGVALFQALAGSLAPEGWLVVGKAERPPLDTLVPVSRCVYRRR